jgi:hypothetical protein
MSAAPELAYGAWQDIDLSSFCQEPGTVEHPIRLLHVSSDTPWSPATHMSLVRVTHRQEDPAAASATSSLAWAPRARKKPALQLTETFLEDEHGRRTRTASRPFGNRAVLMFCGGGWRLAMADTMEFAVSPADAAATGTPESQHHAAMAAFKTASAKNLVPKHAADAKAALDAAKKIANKESSEAAVEAMHKAYIARQLGVAVADAAATVPTKTKRGRSKRPRTAKFVPQLARFLLHFKRLDDYAAPKILAHKSLDAIYKRGNDAGDGSFGRGKVARPLGGAGATRKPRVGAKRKATQNADDDEDGDEDGGSGNGEGGTRMKRLCKRYGLNAADQDAEEESVYVKPVDDGDGDGGSSVEDGPGSGSDTDSDGDGDSEKENDPTSEGSATDDDSDDDETTTTTTSRKQERKANKPKKSKPKISKTVKKTRAKSKLKPSPQKKKRTTQRPAKRMRRH